MSYQFKLEIYSGKNSRHTCPECRAKNEFTRYIDVYTNEHIGENVGKCNRVDKCGYHYSPQQHFKDNGTKPINHNTKNKRIHIQPNVSYINNEVFDKSLRNYNDNNLVRYLIRKFGDTKTYEQIHRYKIGTSKHWQGSTVFWQQDLYGKIRTGKIMLYSPDTGKRIKEPYNYITWAHKALELPEYHLKQSFFGEHLLMGNDSPVAIVESEKTCIIASMYLPQYLWIATSGKDGLTYDKCNVLAGRKGMLWPDVNSYDSWHTKTSKIPYLSGFSVSDLLERKATTSERETSLDLADYLQRFNLSTFI